MKDDKLFHKWNKILKSQGLESVRPDKPTTNEQEKQKASKKRGLPEWAHWKGQGLRGLKGSRK